MSSPTPLDVGTQFWDRVFLVSPLVLVGTREEDGAHDLAPKHMAMPLGWDHYFGFVCTPMHATYRNIKRTGQFTVSFPRAGQVVEISLAASPRCEDCSKPELAALATFPAREVDGVLLEGAYFFLECRLERLVEGLGRNNLVIGEVVAAAAAPEALRQFECDDEDVVRHCGMLAYLNPGRFARIDISSAFPFPDSMQR